MDRDQLKQWIEQGLSLEQIAAVVDRDPSTVGYWVKKHGLEPNGRRKHAARGGLTPEELRPLVAKGLTHREIAERVDRSIPTVRYWITQHGLEQPRRVRRREVEAAAQKGHTVTRLCRRHGETEYAIVGSAERPRCKKCRSAAVARRRRHVKATVIAEKGGCCIICGYARCLRALHLHHVDPKTKAFGIAFRGYSRSLAAVREEAKKCVVLCSNCHMEVEEGIASLPPEAAGPGVPGHANGLHRSGVAQLAERSVVTR